MPDRNYPNILLIMSDQHAPQTMGCMGAEYAITPHLDRLAAGGTTFDNAYCNFALCVPSRNSFMTGLLPWRIGAYDNSCPFSSRLPTWAHMLRREGYRTVLDGKMHFQGDDQLHGFEEHWHETFRRELSGTRWGEEQAAEDAERWVTETSIVPDAEYHTVDVDRQAAALEFLQNAPADSPWSLTVGYIYPHYPLICTESAYDLYEGVEIPLPETDENLHPRNTRWLHDVWKFHRVSPEQTREARRVYMAMVTMMDAWIGQLLETLESTGQMENTVVIYTSDHGELLGEHGIWGKNLFYEWSSRVPLVVHAPALGVREGRRIATPVSLLDLYPTLRSVAGAADWEIPLDGRDLWGACRGTEALADEPVFCEYFSHETIGPERMMRLGKWKLNYYHHQPMELFDLEKDPGERRNLADDPAHVATRDRLLARLLEDWDPDLVEADIRLDQHRRCLIGESWRGRTGRGRCE